MFEIYLQGLIFQASLILALGAQNVYVLNSGLLRQRHIFIAFVSSVCDVILILIGVLGVATLFVQIPMLKISFGILGTLFLGYYGLLKLKEGFLGVTIATQNIQKSSIKKTFYTTLAFSILNPHVLLDTIVLVGGYSAQYEETPLRLAFGLGAGSFSIIWFFGLALTASACNRFVKNQTFMRSISFASGIILIGLAARLGYDVWKWIT